MTEFSGDPAHLIPANSKLRKSRAWWRVLFFVALGIAILAAAGRFALEAPAAGGRPHRPRYRRAAPSSPIAIASRRSRTSARMPG